MAAPNKPNPYPAAQSRRQIGLEAAAVKLRTDGRPTVTPRRPTEHAYKHKGRCWTPTLCAARQDLDKLRTFANTRRDAELLALVDQLAEYFPAIAGDHHHTLPEPAKVGIDQ